MSSSCSETDSLLPSCHSEEDVCSESFESAGSRTPRPVSEPSDSGYSTSSAARPPTPLPWRPLLAVYLLYAAQPLVFELVFPFVNQMILEIGVVDDPKRVGFYSGIIESSFSFMSFLAVLPCSYIADRWGRKPVILLGICGLATSIPFFGMSQSYWFMLVTRCLGGVLAGGWSASKIMVAEMTDKTNQGAAFSGLSISYRLGQAAGQPIGGLLSHPERHWSLFRSPFWYRHPYSLPCFVASALAFAAIILGCLFLPETLASKRKANTKRSKYGATVSLAAADISSEDTSDSLPATRKLHRPSVRSVLTRPVVSLLVSTVGMTLSSEAMFALYPLYAFTPIKSGGLGLSEAGIGTHLALRSAIHVALMFLYTPLQRRFGTTRMFQLSMMMWPLIIGFPPLLNCLARLGVEKSWLFNALLIIFFTLWGMAGLSWTGIGIMVNDAAPSAGALAAINGISQMSIVLPQAAAPAPATTLFAISVESRIAGGNLIWLVLLTLTSATALHALSLKEAKHDWREEYKDAVEN